MLASQVEVKILPSNQTQTENRLTNNTTTKNTTCGVCLKILHHALKPKRVFPPLAPAAP